MSGTNTNSKSIVVYDKENRTQYVYRSENRKIDGVFSKEIQTKTEISENREYTRSVQSGESYESKSATKTSATLAVEYPKFFAVKERSNLKNKPDNRTRRVYTNMTYENDEKREINKVISEKIKTESVQSGESNESEPATKNSPTPAGGNREIVPEKERSNLKKKTYVRLDYSTYSNMDPKLFDLLNMTEPDVIFSIISDSDYPTAKGSEVNEAMSNGSVQNICRSLVKAAASTKTKTSSESTDEINEGEK